MRGREKRKGGGDMEVKESPGRRGEGPAKITF